MSVVYLYNAQYIQNIMLAEVDGMLIHKLKGLLGRYHII